MGMQQRPQKLPDPKEMRQKNMEQYNKANRLLRESLDDAKVILRDGNYGSHDATAVVNLGLILFQIEMAKEQGQAKVKQLEEYIKAQKAHLKKPQLAG